jgi:hypothetical protein
VCPSTTASKAAAASPTETATATPVAPTTASKTTSTSTSSKTTAAASKTTTVAAVTAATPAESAAGPITAAAKHRIKTGAALGRRLAIVEAVKRARWTLGLKAAHTHGIHVVAAGVDLAELANHLDGLVLLVAGLADVLRLRGAPDNERLQGGAERGNRGGGARIQAQRDPIVEPDEAASQQLNLARREQHQVNGSHLKPRRCFIVTNYPLLGENYP